VELLVFCPLISSFKITKRKSQKMVGEKKLGDRGFGVVVSKIKTPSEEGAKHKDIF
jgi:hypothetical protein